MRYLIAGVVCLFYAFAQAEVVLRTASPGNRTDTREVNSIEGVASSSNFGFFLASYTVTSINPGASLDVIITAHNGRNQIYGSTTTIDQEGTLFTGGWHSGIVDTTRFSIEAVTTGRVNYRGRLSVYEKGENIE